MSTDNTPSVIPFVPSSYEKNATDAIRANPDLSHDPYAVHGIASTTGVDGFTLGQMSKYQDFLKNIKGTLLDHATSDKTANGFWGDVTHVLHNVSNWAEDLAQINPWYTGQLPKNQRTNIGNAALQGWEDAAKGTIGFLNRTVNTTAEAGTLGLIGTQGFGNFSANLNDLNQTLNNAVNIPKDWRMGKHTYAYIESMAHQHGLGYTIAYLFPSLLTAAAGGEVITGGETASDLATMARLSQKISQGAADSNDIARYMAAATREARKYNPITAPSDIAASGVEDAAKNLYSKAVDRLGEIPDNLKNIFVKNEEGKYSGAFGAAKDLFQPLTRWTIGPFAKLAKTYLQVTSDPRLFGIYATIQQQAMSDPRTAALWRATENGVVLDSRGMPMHLTPGQSLAESLGLDQGTFGYKVLSGATDMAAFNSSDPLTTPFHVLDAVNSAHGVGGILGRWWGGLGVETGADVYAKAGSTARNRRAFQYMADHGESDIRKMFKGLYTDGRNGTVNMYRILADAKTFDDVVDIHAAIADGAGLTGYVLPTTRIWRLGTRALVKGIGDIAAEGINAFSRNVPLDEVARSIDILNAELVKYGFPEIDIASSTQAATDDIRQLAKGSISRRIKALSTESVWKIDEAQVKGEIPSIGSYAFKLGDKDTIPLFQRMFQQTGQFDSVSLRALGDVLRAAKSDVEFGNTLVNLSTVIVSGQLYRKLGEKYELLKDYFEPMIRQDFENLYGFRGGGAFKNTRVYAAGPNGQEMSTFQSIEDPSNIGMYGTAFRHIRSGKFIDPRQISGMLNKYAKAAAIADNSIFFKASEARALTDNQLERVAVFKKAIVKDAETEMKDIVEKKTNSLIAKDSLDMAQGYRDGYQKVIDASRRAVADDSKTMEQQFVAYAKNVSNLALTAAQKLKLLIEQADQYNLLKEQSDNAIKLNSPEASDLRSQLGRLKIIPKTEIEKAKGEIQALMDMEARIYKQISEPGTPIKSIEDLNKAIGKEETADLSKEARAAKKEARRLATEKMAKFRSKEINYLRAHNKIADFFNKGLSNILIPEMLSTGAYLIRVSSSEMLLNISRIGPINYFESRLAASIAKHQLQYEPLESANNIAGPDIPSADYYHGTSTYLPGGKPGSIKTGKAAELNAKKPNVVNVSENKLLTKLSMSKANILLDTGRFSKALYMGSLTGVERGILQSMSPERFERMLLDYAVALKLGNGHIADIDHGINQIYGNTREHAAMSKMSYGIDNEERVISNRRLVGEGFTLADKTHIASALFDGLNLIHLEKEMYLPIAMDIAQMVKENGYTFNANSTKVFMEDLIDKQIARLNKMPQSELEAFGAWGKLLASNSSGDPVRDFAMTQVSSTWHTLAGQRSALKSGTESIFHQDLIDQAVSGQIKSEPELAKDYASAKGSYPMHLIGPANARPAWETHGVRRYLDVLKSLSQLPKITNDVVLDRLFGNVVTWMSREPVFLWEFHSAMEEARPRIASNLITQDQAEVDAMNRAFTRMVRYVHNPSDRFQFEQATRILAPFWFAKNQAYRRAFRLLDEDPAAFVRYLRICMRTTDYFHHYTQNNQNYLAMPGGTETAQFFVNSLTSGNDLLGNFYTNMGFSLMGDPTAIQTVDPLSGPNGVNMIETLLRPDASPYVSVLAKVSLDALQKEHVVDPVTHAEILRGLLGDIGSKTGIFSDVMPSSFWRDATLYGIDLTGMLGGGRWTLGNVAQVQATAEHEALSNMISTYIDQYYAINNIKTPSDTDHVNALHYAQEQSSIWFNEGTNKQQFIERAYVAALALSFGRLIFQFASPITPIIQANFNTAKFNEFVNLRMPDGAQIPFSEAQYLFAQKYPQDWVDTISTSNNPFGPFPETTTAANWYNKVPNLLDPNKGYPNLFAYGIPSTGTYLPGMFQNLISLQLRSRGTPDEYINTFLTSCGNDFYYGQLEKQYYSEYGAWYGPSDPNNVISAQGYKLLKAAAQNWGNNNNPTWLQHGSPFGTSSKPNETKAIEQLASFLQDKAAQDQVIGAKSLWSRKDIQTLSDAYYNHYVPLIRDIQEITSSTGKYGVEQELSNYMNTLASDPANANIARLLTSVLAKAPTK